MARYRSGAIADPYMRVQETDWSMFDKPAAPQPAAPPPPSPAPPPPAPTMPAPAAAPQASPAMQSLSAVAEGEGLREGFMREGWAEQGAPDLQPPSGRQLPASSRALAQLMQERGRLY
jgi:hypothetical protein